MSVSFCFTDTLIRERTAGLRNVEYQFMIETERLLLRPLSSEQLKKYLQNDNSLEEELGLNKSRQKLSDELKEAIEYQILPSLQDSAKDYLYNTLWIAISKKSREIVGGLAFKGEPNAYGEIELGYGMYEAFQQQGLMSEMVASIVSWAKSRNEVLAIRANSGKNNVASSKVLVKNGFEINGMDEEFFHWILPFHL